MIPASKRWIIFSGQCNAFFEPRAEKETGATKREERFLKVIWPQVGEIHDLHFGPDRGTFFNGQQPLTLEVRFGEQKRKKP